ncbi:MAG: hypothetical protein HY717_17640 [Planctomycetes bacterium]|nr:hypothetical protein [Planctomycetota bacterium]
MRRSKQVLEPNEAKNYPSNFEELAKKLDRDLDPLGRDVRCIVSVGMLTEGWDCNTVTHIIGPRPDFIVRLKGEPPLNVILETKGFDLLEDVKRAAADRWAKAVNADGTKGRWLYAIAKKPTEIDGILKKALENSPPSPSYSLPPSRR